MKTKYISLAAGLAFLASMAIALANDVCPVSGEPVDSKVSITVNGAKVNFCCGDCSKSYQKTMNVVDKGPDKCPISGKAALKENRLLHAKTSVEYFCCGDCPKTFAEKQAFAIKDQGPAACPVSGKPAKKDSALVHNGETIYFCCNECPKTYLKKIAAADPGPDTAKCPISGKAVTAENKMLVTKTEAVYFCCGDCPNAYAKKNFQ